MDVHNYNKLVEKIKKYNANCDFSLLEKAFILSKEAHGGQQRESNEPFIMHPLEVAHIIADLELDLTSVIAALLHDTIEDTTCTYEELKENFGEEIATIVDGVTKLEKIPFTTKEEQQAENLRKMFLAMAKDIRVILIKLADRLHNMRTLKYVNKEKQVEKAKETLEIYAPLAHRLGMSKIKWELEDISLRYIDAEGYYELVDKIAKKRKEREAYITKITETLKEKTKELSIDSVIEGRPKHFYSIYTKMVSKSKTIDQVYDLFAIRIIVDTVKDCYSVLGLVHELYKPIPGRFKDYIAMPKPNMYQSLHTTLIGPEGQPVEIQIRTWEMHKIAEVGIAAHWTYKESTETKNEIDDKFVWLRQLLDWQKEMRDANEFMETLKIDLFTEEVFVFTPKGDVISLSAGSCPIDFAYSIHSAIGNKMMGAKVNNKIVTLDYELKNGDIIDILTSSNIHGPSLDWLKIVKTSQARNKIKQWFKKEKKEENIIRGKDIIEKELKKQMFTFNQLFKSEWVAIALKKLSFNSLDDIYASIGCGAISVNKLISKLKEEYTKNEKDIRLEDNKVECLNIVSKERRTKPPENGVVVKGIENCLVRISKCCNPVPGDSIVGFITRGRGVSVHRKDCVNIKNCIDKDDRLIEVEWFNAVNITYQAEVNVLAEDRTALLMEITNLIAQSKIPLKAINARTNKHQIAMIKLTFEITDTKQLESISKKLKKIEGVLEVTRNK